MSFHYASARCDGRHLSNYEFHETLEQARVRAKSFSSKGSFILTPNDSKPLKKKVKGELVAPPIIQGYVYELVLGSRVAVNGLNTTIIGGDVGDVVD